MTRVNRTIVKIIYISILLFSFYTPYYQENTAKLSNTDQPIIPSSSDYQFLWEEFEGALGDLPGDDILTYGASFGPFHNYEEIFNKLYQSNKTFPEIVDFFSIGKTYFGREIYCIKITNESRMEKKTEMLVIAQHHAREQITVENAFYFMDKLINGSLMADPDIENILNRKEIYIIPSLNIDGAMLLYKFPWQRKNARPIDADGDGISDEFNGITHVFEPSDTNGDGYIDAYYKQEADNIYTTVGFEGVDLDNDGKVGEDAPGGVDPNRNYGIGFGNPLSTSNDPNSDNFCGPYAFSENCTARLRDFIEQHDFKLAVSLHSGVQAIYFPKNASTHPQNETDANFYRYVALNLTRLIGYRYYYSSLSAGQWVNWMYWRKNSTTIAVNIETYNNENTFFIEEINPPDLIRFRGIWDKNNPPANQVMSNCKKIYKALWFLAGTTFFQEPEETPTTIGISTTYILGLTIFIVGIAIYIRINKKGRLVL